MLFSCRNHFISLLLVALLSTYLIYPIDQGRFIKNSSTNLLLIKSIDQTKQAYVMEQYKQSELHFEPNMSSKTEFILRGSGYTVLLDSHRMEMSLSSRLITTTKPTKMSIKLKNANPEPIIKGEGQLISTTNYINGSDPMNWQVDVPNYHQVRYQDIYPGIDMVYYGKQQNLEYDFIVAAGADPNNIKFGFEGVKNLQINDNGDLVIKLEEGELIQHKPIIFQDINGSRQEIAGKYIINNENELGFALGDYDKSRSLIIDPVLSYANFVGGSGYDCGNAIALDAQGNVYMALVTDSTDIATLPPLQVNNGGNKDICILKFNAAGMLIYSTYLGGIDFDQPLGIAVDINSNVYLTGNTHSANFPTANAFQSHCNNCQLFPENGQGDDAFVLALNASGDALIFSTYFGGNGSDRGTGITVNANGIYIVGATNSTDPTLPTTPGARSFNGHDAFIAHFSLTGALLACIPIGGSDVQDARSISADGMGNIFVSGTTYSIDFPILNGYNSVFVGPAGGSPNAYLVKLDSSLQTLKYSTFLEFGQSLAVVADNQGFAYASTNTANGVTNVTKINTNSIGTVSKVYTTSLGVGRGKAITIDAVGNIYVAGDTDSLQFITIPPANANGLNGQRDFFLTKLNSTGDIIYSITRGGSGQNSAFGTVSNSSGVYLTGFIDSNGTNFPALNGLQSTYRGGPSDAFLVKVVDNLIQFSANAYTVDENGGNAVITVNRIGGESITSTISYSTSNGTAISGIDYTGVQGTLAFAPGETSKSFTIPIINDNLIENNETITINLSDPTNGAVLGMPSQVTLTIIDNDVDNKPQITGFSPSSGTVGTQVSITGINFTGATNVKFGGIAATSFIVNSATLITANVPSGAASGVISVTTPAGTATSSTNFTIIVVEAPKITTFTPTSGMAGSEVTINGSNLNGVLSVKFNGVASPSITQVSSTQIKATVPVGTSNGPIMVTTAGGSATSTGIFKITPSILSFSPISGIRGSMVTIMGTDLGLVTAVKFNNAPASFTVNSNEQITAQVPPNSTTGKISLTSSSGIILSGSDYTVILAPTITSFSPISGKTGTLVTINGSNFVDISSIRFNGMEAVNITPVSSSQIKVTVPVGATTGKIVISNPAGSTTSTTVFNVK